MNTQRQPAPSIDPASWRIARKGGAGQRSVVKLVEALGKAFACVRYRKLDDDSGPLTTVGPAVEQGAIQNRSGNTDVAFSVETELKKKILIYRRAKFIVRVLMTSIVLTSSCNAFSQSTTKWESDSRFPGTFFPAFAISAAGKDSNGPVDTPQTFGYISSASFGVKVLSAPQGSKIKVEIAIPSIGVSGEIEAPPSANTESRHFLPRLSWSQGRLAAITQPLSTEIIYRVYIDGTLDREERKPLRIRAITDAPLLSCREPGKCTDYSPYMAAYVNENHPAIDTFLRSALDVPANPVKSWIGTQGSEDDTLRQVWAIWYLLQRQKFTYSSITTVSDERADISSQTIRPLSQALRTAQGNCIDGTVLFASVLRKIGIEPMIVLIPGHAFLGFFIDSKQQHRVFLETTMLNSGSNPFHQKGPSKLGTSLAGALGKDVHQNQSWNSFLAAIDAGNREFTEASPNFDKKPGYRIIPIAKARQSGILPLPL